MTRIFTRSARTGRAPQATVTPAAPRARRALDASYHLFAYSP